MTHHARPACAAVIITGAILAFGAPATPGARPGAQAPAAPRHDRATGPAGWTLTWADEFAGANGSGFDRSHWVPEVNGNGFGNNELEYYRDDPRNVSIRDNMLAIDARKEPYTGTDGVTRQYTSARLKSQGKFSQRYGRFEARIKIPAGQGIWPAFWMLGDDIVTANWPTCGEIDIMENIGREPATVHGTIHGPGYFGANGIGAAYASTDGRPFADDFHVYAVEWEPRAIRWYVDDALYETRTPSDLPAGSKWVFDHPFFIILNVAVGGGWPGSPDASTVFPQTMLVDYVRVYARAGASVASCDPPSAPRGASVDVRVTGSGFEDGATVSFGPKIRVVSTAVASESEIDVRIKIKKRAARGARDVVVTNADGGVGTGSFVVD